MVQITPQNSRYAANILVLFLFQVTTWQDWACWWIAPPIWETVFESIYKLYLSQIAKCICLELPNVFAPNCEIYLSQIAKYICLKITTSMLLDRAASDMGDSSDPRDFNPISDPPGANTSHRGKTASFSNILIFVEGLFLPEIACLGSKQGAIQILMTSNMEFQCNCNCRWVLY